MDLKGSLIDTNLRIYPTEKLISFLKTVQPSEDLPYNIRQIITSQSSFKSYKLHYVKKVHLNNSDLKSLKEIWDGFNFIDENDLLKVFNKEVKSDLKKNIEDDIYPKSINKMDNENRPIENELQKKINDNNESEIKKSSKEQLNISECQVYKPFLVTSDIDWLYEYIKSKRDTDDKDIPYLHKLLEGASIEVPENQTIKRNPILEARCVKLRAQQEAREYRRMTKGVDNVRMVFPEDSISYQLKQVNRQLIAVGQFVISIFAGFVFGFNGVEWMVGDLDFGFRLLLGVMCALVIALAEIYFLAKKINEELSIPETVQLGGPVKFAENYVYDQKTSDLIANKKHQD